MCFKFIDRRGLNSRHKPRAPMKIEKRAREQQEAIADYERASSPSAEGKRLIEK